MFITLFTLRETIVSTSFLSPEKVLIASTAILDKSDKIVVIFFGANKIPEIFRGFGKGIREFKDASKEIKKEIEKESTSDSDKK